MYTKTQRDIAWALFATAVAQQKQITEMQDAWDKMKRHSAVKDKIIAELKSGAVRDDNIYVAQVNKSLWED